MDVRLAVLVVEDNEIVAASVHRLLERSGFDVTVAESIAEATELAQHDEFLVCLLDIHLEDGSGVQLAERLRARRYGCEFVFHTGDALDGPGCERATELGSLVAKGIPARRLVKVVVESARTALRRVHPSARPSLLRLSLGPPRGSGGPAKSRVSRPSVRTGGAKRRPAK